MDALTTIRENLNEKQFTQLGYNLTNGKYVVSAYFRCSNKFNTISYNDLLKATKFYNEMIK